MMTKYSILDMSNKSDGGDFHSTAARMIVRVMIDKMCHLVINNSLG